MERYLHPTRAGHVHLARTSSSTVADVTVVLLHQVPSSGRMWYAVADRLDSVDCVVPDLLGYGCSDTPSRQLDLVEHAALLCEAVASVASGPVVLVGHHSGAALAAQMALVGEVAGLAVVGVGLIGYPLYGEWEAKLARLGGLIKPIRVDQTGDGLVDPWLATTAGFEAGTEDDVRIRAFADRLRGGVAWYSGYVQLLGADLQALLDQLARQPIARLVMVASRDVVSADADQVAHALGVPLRRVEGGPWVTLEHPDTVAGQLSDWLDEITITP